MSKTAEFSIGSEVTCSDGVCGDLRRVVVDPVARSLTHLVVEPRHRPGTGHLVPIGLVASTTEGIRLRCNKSEFEALDAALTALIGELETGATGKSRCSPGPTTLAWAAWAWAPVPRRPWMPVP